MINTNYANTSYRIQPKKQQSFRHLERVHGVDGRNFEEKMLMKKTLQTSLVSSIGAILLTLAAIAKRKQAKGIQNASMFNLHLQEPEIFALGTATTLGALAGGVAVDKKENRKAKYREALHQIVGNIATPLAFTYILNKGFDKIKFKMPNLKGSSKPVVAVNTALNILPNLIVTGFGLFTGIHIGNKISEKINDKIFGKNFQKREIKTADYCIHIDDPLTILTLADKSGKIRSITSKITPFTFILSGYQVGSAHSHK